MGKLRDRYLPKLPTLHQMYLTKKRVDTRSILQRLVDRNREALRDGRPISIVSAEDVYDAVRANYTQGVAGALRSIGNRKEDQ